MEFFGDFKGCELVLPRSLDGSRERITRVIPWKSMKWDNFALGASKAEKVVVEL